MTQQQIKYVEYRLQGGVGAGELFWNCPGWGSALGKNGILQLVDGLQRYTAVQKFMNNEIPAFGHKLEEYEDNINIVRHNFVMTVNNLEKYSDVLQWYVDLNAGGIAHSDQEIDRIKQMIKNVKLSEEKG